MTRLDVIPEEQGITEIQDLRKELDEIKQRQIFGDDNLLTYFVRGEDIVINVTPFQTYIWNITYIPNSLKKTYNYLEILASFSSATGFEFYSWGASPTSFSEEDRTTWRLYLTNDSNSQTVTFNIGFRALEEGTVEWNQV